jgi:homocysteine S-methyltransferase
MNPIGSILSEHGLMLLDGALASELERRGCDLNDALWSAKVLMENPDLIGAVHRDYYAAGADCATSASYQASVEGFMRRGLSEARALELIALSVGIARRARDEFWASLDASGRAARPYPLVAASVGPYGAFLADGSEYRGDYRDEHGQPLGEEALVRFHRQRLQALVAAGPDLLACETIPCLVEAKAIARLLPEFPGCHAWISFSARDGAHINSGEAIADCARALDGCAQVAAIGVNCTAPQYVESLIGEIRKGTTKPILCYPNSGEQYDATDKRWHGAGPANSHAAYGQLARRWHACGATIIGGCCRTSPRDIAEIAAWARPVR